MYPSFFLAAARSRSRQISWRTLAGAHLLITGGCFWIAQTAPPGDGFAAGLVLLLTGIVEGALLVGWRLTQLPKSRALEFLLASPLRPSLILLSEALIGLVWLALLSLTGLPTLLLLVQEGALDVRDLGPLLLLPWTWGAIAGLALTVWAYEPARRRWWAERVVLGLVLVYLVVGVLAGEKLLDWLAVLPVDVSVAVLGAFELLHTWNPFAVMKYALQEPPQIGCGRFLILGAGSLGLVVLLLGKAALGMQAHYQERHYRPLREDAARRRLPVGLRPLSWWAVKRVSEYSGRVNLWLAGGFGLLYALHTLAGDWWPDWMGRKVFEVFDQSFGLAGVGAGLLVLAAVPAAFQYGLWDSSAQERCRRLELLLLTRLDGVDFYKAALTAAWRRGSGYFVVALVLWGAAVMGEKMTLAQAVLAAAAGLLMWMLYFSLGFRAFTRGLQASNLGLLLTVGLPVVTVILCRAGLPALAALTPPGAVYLAACSQEALLCLPGLLLTGVVTLWVHRVALARCLEELKKWYERYHGRKIMD